MAKTAYFVRKDQWDIVSFSYSPELVDELKQAIPGRCRKWDQVAKHWWISRTWWNDFVDLMEQHGYLLEEATE
jgi:hypothetical protein